MATCTEVLAEFALKETLQSLPTSMLEKAKLMILDGVGLALAARARISRRNDERDARFRPGIGSDGGGR